MTEEKRNIPNYTGYGWAGENYQPYRNVKDIAADIRAKLKAKYPACKWSVTIERYSGGQSIHLSLMAAPWPAFSQESEHWDRGYSQLNEYTVVKDFTDGFTNGAYLTREAWEACKFAVETCNSYRQNDSDGMIDYFHCNFYFHLNIGKWDKPFQQIGGGNE